MRKQPLTSVAGWPALALIVLIAATPLTAAQSARRDRAAGKAAGQADPSDDPFDKASDRSDVPPTPGDDAPPPKAGGLRMSRAVVCKSIDGYENYKPLPGAAQTSEEKLLVYFRPLRYKIDYVDGFYRAHLVQDNEIRRRGRREIVRYKKKVVEYDPKSKEPLGPIYIRNTISLKGLEPGDYDLTIILRDELDKSAPPTRQLVKFKVIPPHDSRTRKAPEKKAPETIGDPPPDS